MTYYHTSWWDDLVHNRAFTHPYCIWVDPTVARYALLLRPHECIGLRMMTHVLNLRFEEQMFARYLRDPQAVSPDWRKHFKAVLHADGANAAAAPRGPSFKPASVFHPNGRHRGSPRAPQGDVSSTMPSNHKQHCVDQLIRNYRVRGHMIAKIDPLGRPRPQPPELDLQHAGLSDADMDTPFVSDGATLPLRHILEQMQSTYCRSIGVQFMHLDDLEERRWLQERMEHTRNRIQLTPDEQFRILKRLTDAVVFEQFLQKKYLGAKTFSLEGAETLIPLLDQAIERASEQGVEQIVMGMSHRGRLDVLANVLNKPCREIFREFEDIDPELHTGGGDVNYHLGYSTDWRTNAGREVHLSLCFNPSHLEFINPVALGRMRARQDRGDDHQRQRGMVLLIHGDAGFAGEGIVQETLNLSQLAAYRVGGTLHVIVNNQLGFTTLPDQYSSSTYCTDVAKMLQVPIFHVNGENPEAVAQVVRLAMDFRFAFGRDVFIDMHCYRLQGHNEGDEPSFTQPLLYQAIAENPSVRDAYLEQLLKLGGVTREEADQLEKQKHNELDDELAIARDMQYPPQDRERGGIWSDYLGGRESKVKDPVTRVDADRLGELLQKIITFPEDFHLHPKLERGMSRRGEMAGGERPIDWSAAEVLAMATLATEGHRIRMSGEDCERGTFSQRHAVLHDVEDGHTYVPLRNLSPDQAPVEIHNSPLTESGVLGFEYGYSLDCPDGLVIWEAQFGDFANSAQVIIDQFIAGAEDKWSRLSGLVLLMPHGFEGQGPEHASARIERFLMLAAEHNMQIVFPSTPAQYFHVLRRQVIRPWRKPLIVLTPKSMLRHKRATSSMDELSQGAFERVLPDPSVEHPGDIQRVLLCSGKIYYDLLEHREEIEREDVALVRVEQLYPFPTDALRTALAGFADDTPTCWVQEEPRNMGAWPYLRTYVCDELFNRLPLTGITRPESASPATGSSSAHKLEQRKLIAQAFGGK